MPTDYCSDYEELTGLKPDGSPVVTGAVETKVVKAPEVPDVAPAVVAETA